jgi:hypothetical protein
MTKYKVGVGAFITIQSSRVFNISANSEEEAIEKAKDRYYKAWKRSNRWNDFDEIHLDFIEQKE